MIKTVISYGLVIALINSCPDQDERCASCVENQCRVCFDGFVDQNGKC